MIFTNRQTAGKQLAAILQPYRRKQNTIVIGLPRGGVVVAAEIAKVLQLPLDVIITRKIGALENPEFAISAVTEEGERVLNTMMAVPFGVPAEYIDTQVKKARKEILRRKQLYRADRAELVLHGKIAVLVDDGIATGHTMRAAIVSARAKGAEKVIVAIPVVAADTLQDIQILADEVIALSIPTVLGSVGSFYKEFDQVSDEEVVALLSSSLQNKHGYKKC